MDPFKNAPLRYRFDDLSQARAHVVSVENRALFFFRHKDLELLPGSALQMEWTFQNSEPARLLHGVALSNVRTLVVPTAQIFPPLDRVSFRISAVDAGSV